MFENYMSDGSYRLSKEKMMEDGYLQYSRIFNPTTWFFIFAPSILLRLVAISSSSVAGLGGAGVGVGDLRGGKVYGGNPLDAPLWTATDFWCWWKLSVVQFLVEQRWCWCLSRLGLHPPLVEASPAPPLHQRRTQCSAELQQATAVEMLCRTAATAVARQTQVQCPSKSNMAPNLLHYIPTLQWFSWRKLEHEVSCNLAAQCNSCNIAKLHQFCTEMIFFAGVQLASNSAASLEV